MEKALCLVKPYIVLFPCLMKLIRLEYLAVKKQERGKDGLNIRFKN